MYDLIKDRLEPLDLQVYEFRDDSHLHIGHSGNRGGGHYTILLISQKFHQLSRVQRQRIVQNLLADLFADKKIHALSIIAKTPDEYFS